MQLLRFKEMLDSSGLKVFHNEQNATDYPYLIYKEFRTSFEYASGFPIAATTDAAVTLFTSTELDLTQLEILNLLVVNKVTISEIRYSLNPETQCFATMFIIKIRHTLDWRKGDIDYLGSV